MTAKKTTPKSVGKLNAAGREEAEFQRLHDKSWKIPHAIKEGLAELGTGWLKNQDFAKHCGINVNDLAAYAEQFAEHIVIIPGEKTRTWWGSKDKAAKWRIKLGSKLLGAKAA